MSRDQLLAHVKLALSNHKRLCQRCGYAFPPLMDTVLTLLASPVDPARSDLAGDVPILLNYRRAATRLAVSYSTVRRLVARGELVTVRVGGKPMIPVAAIEEFVEVRSGRARPGDR